MGGFVEQELAHVDGAVLGPLGFGFGDAAGRVECPGRFGGAPEVGPDDDAVLLVYVRGEDLIGIRDGKRIAVEEKDLGEGREEESGSSVLVRVWEDRGRGGAGDVVRDVAAGHTLLFHRLAPAPFLHFPVYEPELDR